MPTVALRGEQTIAAGTAAVTAAETGTQRRRKVYSRKKMYLLVLVINVNVNMRFIVPPLLKEHGCITWSTEYKVSY